jgi:hypothetical protein
VAKGPPNSPVEPKGCPCSACTVAPLAGTGRRGVFAAHLPGGDDVEGEPTGLFLPAETQGGGHAVNTCR